MAAHLLSHFNPSEKTPAHHYTVLPPLAAQLLSHFTPSEKTPPHSYNILPPW